MTTFSNWLLLQFPAIKLTRHDLLYYFWWTKPQAYLFVSNIYHNMICFLFAKQINTYICVSVCVSSVLQTVVWLCMIVYDYVCLCMTIYDYVWLCITMYDCVLLCITMYDYVCLCKPMYAYVWLHTFAQILCLLWLDIILHDYTLFKAKFDSTLLCMSIS